MCQDRRGISRLKVETVLSPSYPSRLTPDLPFVDVHEVLVSAPAAAVWLSLPVQVSQFAPAEAFARLLAAEPHQACGKPLDEGATLPGFEVVETVPGKRVQLAGQHRFSRYALILILEAQADHTVVKARTHAEFPGLRGRVYRRLVIGSGAHRVLVKRLLEAVRREAEARSAC